MIRTAVILAAGLGSRLGRRAKDRPKGFVEVGGRALILRSLERLKQAGIRRVFIGTGYGSTHYDALSCAGLEFYRVKNPDFAATGSMATLAAIAPSIDEDFLLLESDLLYEARALDELLADPRADLVLGSDATHSGDEVYLEVDSEGFLQKVSKEKGDLSSSDSELVGISKISLSLLRRICQVERQSRLERPRLDYESALAFASVQALATGGFGVPVKRVEGMAWCEVDDADHLRRAIDLVLPLIEERESHGRARLGG